MRARTHGLKFLSAAQHSVGSWSPLWFGNQDHPSEDNPVYGTAKVLMAYRDLGRMDSPEAQRGIAWLVTNQNADGGWGSGVWTKAESRKRKAEQGPPSSPKSPTTSPLQSSIEETALALEALLATLVLNPATTAVAAVPGTLNPCLRGLSWLLDRVEADQQRQPAPIGFYFAKLWYYERLYPLIFTVAALGRACRQFAHPKASPDPAETASTDAP